MIGTWQTSPDNPGISRRHVDVWLTSTELGEEEVRACRTWLTPGEVARAEKFKVESKFREYIITRGLLRRVLSGMTGLDIAGVEFDYGEHGKPSLVNKVNGEGIAFNVSHSHGVALVALTLGSRLGVDLEKIRSKVEWRALAEEYFSAAECRALNDCPRDERLKAFFTCWTRKEAFVKALGAGISYGLKEFDVSIDPGEDRALLAVRAEDEDAARWLIKNIPLPGGEHVAALAVDRPACRFRFWRVTGYGPRQPGRS